MELRERGQDAASLLGSLGLPENVPASHDLFVAAPSIYELVERSADVAGDSFLGYSIGCQLDLQAWEPIAKAVQEADTIGEMLSRFVVYALEHSSSTRFFLRTEGDRSTFGFERVAEPTIKPAQNDAFYLGFISSMLMRATHEHWDSTLVLFRVADPAVIPATASRLRVAKGDNRGIQVKFPTAWLFERFEKSSFHVDSPAYNITNPPNSLIGSVRQALIHHLHEPGLTVDKAANICGYKKRRLSKDLREEGTTLAKEIAKLKTERAGQRLANSDSRIADIAQAVGFKDPTVFSRAFKNWTGQSPQEYRKTHR